MKKTKEKEHYLKEIYRLEINEQTVTVSKLVIALEVSKSSASNMIKKLVKMKLVDTSAYQPIKLTPIGKEQAQTIVAKHRLVEAFVVEIMGFSVEEVHEIAEEIEHIDSSLFFRKVKQMLKQHKIDPHGSIIPDVDF